MLGNTKYLSIFAVIICLTNVTNAYASSGPPYGSPPPGFPSSGSAGIREGDTTEVRFRGSGIQPCSPIDIAIDVGNGDAGNTVDSYIFNYIVADDGTFELPIISAFLANSVVGDVRYLVMLEDPQLSPEDAMDENRTVFGGSLVDPSTIDLQCLSAAEAVELQCPGVPGIDSPATPIPAINEIYLVEDEHLKVQFEDLGSSPGGLWVYADAPDSEGNQDNFQGSGYYIWGSSASSDLNPPMVDSALIYRFFVPEGQEGEYNLRIHTSRDGGAANDAQNDIWMSINGDISTLPSDLPPLVVDDTESYVKTFGIYMAQCTSFHARSTRYEPQDHALLFPDAVINVNLGINEIAFYGRSQGYHIDFFELYKDNWPLAINSPDSGYYTVVP